MGTWISLLQTTSVVVGITKHPVHLVLAETTNSRATMVRAKKKSPRRSSQSPSIDVSPRLLAGKTNLLSKDSLTVESSNYGNLSESQILGWSVRRVQYVYLTVEFQPFVLPMDTTGITHDCLYCFCRCQVSVTNRDGGVLNSTDCDHCQYYPESHPGRCFGQHREGSGSIAYILRHELVKEMPAFSEEDNQALAILRVTPFGFALIEKVRQCYHLNPLGSEFRIEPLLSVEHFIVSIGLNGYEGYRLMLTTTNSTVKPMSHERWHRWYRTQIHLMTYPPESIGCKLPIPRRSRSSGARYFHHTVVETDLVTGTKFYTSSPPLRLGEDDRYIRLELTSSPLDDGYLGGIRCLGKPRTFRTVTTENVCSDPVYLQEDMDSLGYPVATLESVPLKQFRPRQARSLHYVIEDEEEHDASEAIPLASDDKYLKIFLTSN